PVTFTTNGTASGFGTPKWLRTKNSGFGVIQRLSAAKLKARLLGDCGKVMGGGCANRSRPAPNASGSAATCARKRRRGFGGSPGRGCWTVCFIRRCLRWRVEKGRRDLKSRRAVVDSTRNKFTTARL